MLAPEHAAAALTGVRGLVLRVVKTSRPTASAPHRIRALATSTLRAMPRKLR
jgi:hypothetical protein